jgi:hypothetical protein
MTRGARAPIKQPLPVHPAQPLDHLAAAGKGHCLSGLSRRLPDCVVFRSKFRVVSFWLVRLFSAIRVGPQFTFQKSKGNRGTIERHERLAPPGT